MTGTGNQPSGRYTLIYQSELEIISRYVLDFPEIETGGDLFGFWTHANNPVIQFVIGPGPGVRRTTTFFNQDADYLIECGNVLRKNHGLQHIGEWHSHHRLGLAHPSGHDVETVRSGIADYGLPRFLLTICTIESNGTLLNGFLFENGRSEFDATPWVPLVGESPIRKDLRSSMPGFIVEPQTPQAQLGSIATTSLGEQGSGAGGTFKEGTWLDSPAGHAILKEAQEALALEFGEVAIELDDQRRAVARFGKDGRFFSGTFPDQFPASPPDFGDALPDLSGEPFLEEWRKLPNDASQRIGFLVEAIRNATATPMA